MWKANKLWIVTLVALQLLLIAGFAWSAPTVTGVKGQVADGQSVTISGSGFGSGPRVAVFDDFEGGTVGQLIQSDNPKIGRYYNFGWNPTSPYITNATSISGTKAMRSNNADGSSNHAGVLLPSPTNEVFASWWMFLPAGTRIPGEGYGGINWKTVWVMGADSGDDDQTLPTFLDGGAYYVAGNDTPYGKWIGLPFKRGEWIRISAWLYGGTPGTATGKVRYYALTQTAGLKEIINETGKTVLKAGGAYERIHFNGYGRQTPNCYPTFDDVYAASGPNAQARVEMGNASSYTASTKLAIITPNSWSSSQIDATVRQGVFKGGEKVYLFVIDANGNPSPGFGPLTIGTTSSGGTTTPSPVDNPPTVGITSPSSTGQYSTTNAQVTIAGTAADDNGISSVTWSSNKGISGTATNISGTWSSWQIGNPLLSEGDNIITVTATDTAGQKASKTITVSYSPVAQPAPAPTPDGTEVWDAQTQTGDTSWKNSSVTYCARLLIKGSSISQDGSQVRLGFQGRSSGDYTIRKVSIAERDLNSSAGNVVDSTWTRVTFDGRTGSTWGSDVVTVPAGQKKFSDPINFQIQAGKDYYVTFKIDTPSVYLNPPSGYEELYFWDTDRTDDVDWAGNGHSVTQDYHALGSILVTESAAADIPTPPTGLRLLSNN